MKLAVEVYLLTVWRDSGVQLEIEKWLVHLKYSIVYGGVCKQRFEIFGTLKFISLFFDLFLNNDVIAEFLAA